MKKNSKGQAQQMSFFENEKNSKGQAQQMSFFENEKNSKGQLEGLSIFLPNKKGAECFQRFVLFEKARKRAGRKAPIYKGLQAGSFYQIKNKC